MGNQFILELSEVGINDIETVGGKNASLGEMIQNLSSLGINIPNGFVVTALHGRRRRRKTRSRCWSVTS